MIHIITIYHFCFYICCTIFLHIYVCSFVFIGPVIQLYVLFMYPIDYNNILLIFDLSWEILRNVVSLSLIL